MRRNSTRFKFHREKADGASLWFKNAEPIFEPRIERMRPIRSPGSPVIESKYQAISLRTFKRGIRSEFRWHHESVKFALNRFLSV